MIAISMRSVELHYPNGDIEKRDALAQDWHLFVKKAIPGRYLLPVPNTGMDAVTLLKPLPISGLILSGGDDWGIYPERDETERLLFEYASQNNWPILGICRGAQVINRLFGGRLKSGFGQIHAGKRHKIEILPNQFFENASLEVNSFHENIITSEDLGGGLQILGKAPDDSIEAFFSADRKVAGIVWHPERERPSKNHDILLMNKLFGRPCR